MGVGVQTEVSMTNKEILRSTAEIVKAYVSRNKVPVETLPQLVTVVRRALSGLEISTAEGGARRPSPAIAVDRSLSRDRIVCLEDGRTFKSLKRHLRAAHGLSPEEYRAKWGLGKRYPMIAPVYSARRSQLALEMGFGRKARRRSGPRQAAKGPVTDAA